MFNVLLALASLFLIAAFPSLSTAATIFSYNAPADTQKSIQLTRALNFSLACRLEFLPEFPFIEETPSALPEEISIEKMWNKDDRREVSRALAALKSSWFIAGNHIYSKQKISSTLKIYRQENGKISHETIKVVKSSADFTSLQKELYSRLYKSITGRQHSNPSSHFPIVRSYETFSHFVIGITLMDEGKNNSAIEEFRKAIAIEPNFRDLRYLLGKFYLTPEFIYEKAVDHFRTIVKLFPKDAPAWFWLGFTLYLKGDNSAAVNAMEEAKRLKPSDLNTYFHLADLYQDTGNYAEALKNYQKALELSPRNAAMWYQIASLYARLDRRQETLESLTKVLELDAASFLDIARFDADFARWKNDKEFKALFEKFKK
ncbi:MAG: tetratricopeptide repeat protein [bacterium]